MLHTAHHQLHGESIALQPLALQSDFFQAFAEHMEEPQKYIPVAVCEHHGILVVLNTRIIIKD
jgi:hypothetical protein